MYKRISLSLLVILTSLLLGCTSQRKDPFAAIASLRMYSGLPDPTWELSKTQAQEFKTRLDELPHIEASEEPGFLGYRGIGVTLVDDKSASTIGIADGKVVVRATGTEAWYADAGRELERWLLETGKPHLKAAEYDLALHSFSTGFALYLLDIPQPQQGTGGGTPETGEVDVALQKDPFISEADIISYNPATYELTLMETAYARYEALQIPVSGLPFAVTVNDRVVYTGTFCTPISSLSNEGIVIQQWFLGDEPIVRFQLGYPESPERFEGEDLRNAEEILNALRFAGKLTD